MITEATLMGKPKTEVTHSIFCLTLKFFTMKKYIVTYHAPAEALAQMGEATPEQREEGMKPWMAWAAKCGDKLVDLGSPLMGGLKLSPGGGSANSQREVCGYSILQADNMDDAKSLMDGHPHLEWMGECEIEIHESMPM